MSGGLLTVTYREPGVPHGIDSLIRENFLGGDASRFIGPVTPVA